MSTQPIHFALIGCGRIASRHIDAIQTVSGAKLVAVCDLNTERAKEKAAQGNVPFYTNYHQMLETHPEIDVITILTPSGMHFEHALEIVSDYQKHVFIEKPFVMTPRQGRQLKQAADEVGKRIFPIFQNRFNKAVQFVKEKMQPQGELGKLRVGTVRLRWCRPQRYYDLSAWRGTWAMDGGALTNQGIHFIDLLRYLCGEVKSVQAKIATLGANIPVEDTVVATVEFENGALGVIEVMTSARPDDFEASISCVCEKGLAVISGVATNELQVYSPNPSITETVKEVFPTVYGFGHDVLIQNIVDSLQSAKPAHISYEDGYKTMQLLHAIYRSDEVGHAVNVAEVDCSARLGQPDDALMAPYRTPSLVTS